VRLYLKEMVNLIFDGYPFRGIDTVLLHPAPRATFRSRQRVTCNHVYFYMSGMTPDIGLLGRCPRTAPALWFKKWLPTSRGRRVLTWPIRNRCPAPILNKVGDKGIEAS